MMSEEGIYLDQLSASDLEKSPAAVAVTEKQEVIAPTTAPAAKKVRVPRRVLHFSDGILEEYSTDDEVEDLPDGTMKQQLVNPGTMSWGGWFGHHAYSKGNTALAACDYVGENIAYFLGITSPKFHYEIEEHKRELQEEERERREAAEQMVGWNSSSSKEGQLEQPASLPQTYLTGNSEVVAPSSDEQQSFSSLPADGARY